jgi:hypothetical protein
MSDSKLRSKGGQVGSGKGHVRAHVHQPAGPWVPSRLKGEGFTLLLLHPEGFNTG